jgi:LPS sulfotransferase NodH
MNKVSYWKEPEKMKLIKGAKPTPHDLQIHYVSLKRRRRLKRRILSLWPLPKFRGVKPERRFVIVAQGRTGSTLLSDLLRSHELIDCDGELFLHWRWFPEQYVLRRMKATVKPVYGFKLLTYQPEGVLGFSSLTPILDWLQSNGFRIIYLRRDNVLRHALSQLSARVNQFSQRGESDLERRRLHIDRETIFYWMELMTSRRMLDESIMKDREFLDVRYERDLEDSQNWHPLFLRIGQFLSVKPHLPNSELKKVTPRRLDELVENLNELRQMLTGTKFEEYLNERL